MRGLPNLKDDGAFQTWAFRIVTRKCAKHIAGLKKSRQSHVGLLGESMLDNETGGLIEQAADRKPIHKALAKLSVEHRSALALFYLEDISVGEVAVALEIPMGTVKSRLRHARNKLRFTERR